MSVGKIASSISALAPWPQGQWEDEFRMRVHEMFTVEEMDQSKLPASRRKLKGVDLEFRSSMQILLHSYFYAGEVSFAIHEAQQRTSDDDVTGPPAICIFVHEMRRLDGHGRLLPLLVLSWCDVNHAFTLIQQGKLNPFQAEACQARCTAQKQGMNRKILANRAEIFRWQRTLEGNEKMFKSKGHPHGKANLTIDWKASVLLPAYPNGGKPTIPEIKEVIRAAINGNPEDVESLVQRYTDAETHHFVVVSDSGPEGAIQSPGAGTRAVQNSSLLRDSNDRVYVFEDRGEAQKWAQKMGVTATNICGMGDKNWKDFQQKSRHVIVKKGSFSIEQKGKVDDPASSRATSVMQSWKEKGNAKMKAGDNAGAISHYASGIAMYRSQEDWAEQSDARKLYVALCSNKALAHLHQQEWQKVLDATSLALEVDSKFTKAKYRRASGLRGLHRLQEALDVAMDCNCPEARQLESDIRAQLPDQSPILAAPEDVSKCAEWSVARLQGWLRKRDLDFSKCLEKTDLIDLVKTSAGLLSAPEVAQPTEGVSSEWLLPSVSKSPDSFKSHFRYLEEGDLCMAVMRGLSEDTAFVKVNFVPFNRERFNRAIQNATAADAEILKIVIRISNGEPSSGIVLSLDKYLDMQRGTGEYRNLFLGHYLRGVLDQDCGEYSASVSDFRAAWEVCKGRHPWVLIWLARAHQESISSDFDLEGGDKANQAMQAYLALIEALDESIEASGEMQSMLCFALWEAAHLKFLAPAMSEKAYTTRAFNGFLGMTSDDLEKSMPDCKEEMSKLAQRAEDAEERCQRELPWWKGISNCKSKEQVRRVLAMGDWIGQLAEQGEAGQQKAMDFLFKMSGCKPASVQSGPAAELDQIAMAASAQETARRRQEENDRVVEAMKTGQMDIFENAHRRFFNETCERTELKKHEHQQLQKMRRQQLDEKEHTLKEKEQQWTDDLHRLQLENKELAEYVDEERTKIEVSFRSREEMLQTEKEEAIRSAAEEVSRVTQKMQQVQEEFEQKEKGLRKEHEDAAALLNEVLQQRDVALAKEDRQQQHQESERLKLELEQRRLEREADLLSRQTEEQKQAAATLADKQRRLSHEKEMLQRQRQAYEQMFALPSWWASTASDQLAIRAEENSIAVAALRSMLEVDRPQELGCGRDQKDWNDRPYGRLHFCCAWRIQHPALWRKYQAEVSKMQSDLKSRRLCSTDISLRDKLRSASAHMPGIGKDDCIGECFLLHGMPPDKVLDIMREGLNERFCGRAAFGFGSYLAEDAGKIDQYVRRDLRYSKKDDLHQILYHPATCHRHPGSVYYMLVCRVALGLAARTRDGYHLINEQGYVWADAKSKAARRELAMAPSVIPPLRFHSEVVDTMPDEDFDPKSPHCVRRYREFVVPHSERIYPEYLVAFQRKC